MNNSVKYDWDVKNEEILRFISKIKLRDAESIKKYINSKKEFCNEGKEEKEINEFEKSENDIKEINNNKNEIVDIIKEEKKDNKNNKEQFEKEK